MRKPGFLILSIAFLAFALLMSFVGPVSHESEPRFLTGLDYAIPFMGFVLSKTFEYLAFEDRSLSRKIFLFIQIPIFLLFVWALNESIKMNLF